LTPVICIVFYHGKQKWKHADLLKNLSGELRRYVPMFDYVLFDTKDIGDQAIMGHFRAPGVRIGVWFLKRNVELIRFIRENPIFAREMLEDLRQIEQTTIERLVLYLYNVSGETPDEIHEVMKTASPESKDIIDVFRARYVQEGIEQGIEKGIEQGLVKTARNMIEKGYSDEQISEVTNLTVKRIQSLRDS